jgi:hypothetical protein
MLQGDPQAIAMWEQFHKVKMPNYHLQDHDVDALFHFFAQETQKARGRSE